ncbi:putative serine/threonine-protein kinase-like protein CCR3 [Lolium rigidum]|uniref:putative serine/threonine-protein kinase-like protein CCR3 n=1 Tax=Lolium rigidum TaxID=89674 RepID=UPI001F5DADF4|nr:putative serine/threonine-protein kinase-like protein CCR3 [Lolium rigidum]
MALWTGLGQAATVAQLVGADVGGLISMIMQAALTARQNRRECEQVARRVLMIAELLPHLEACQEAVRPLAGLGDTLREAHELVVSCQGRNLAYQLAMAGRQANRFREVQNKIDSYLILFPIISHIGITRRLDRIYNILVPDSATSSASPPSSSPQVQEPTEVAREVLPHGTEEFTLAEIMAATNNFADDTIIGQGGSAIVYRGRLSDGREVAIKRARHPISSDLEDEFRTEIAILSQLQHKHIVRLLGTSCWSMNKEKHLLSLWRKRAERLLVYEYMDNGTLHDHLHNQPSSSPVTVSWKMRIDVLLGVSRAIEHLHCHAVPPVIHGDIKPANILLDSSWVPRLSDFGASVDWNPMKEYDTYAYVGTIGYLDPEYFQTGHLKPASDVYSLGVLMLEVLTGKKGVEVEGPLFDLPSFALPIIEAGNLEELLDKRPSPEPTPRHTASDSDIVTNSFGGTCNPAVT